MNAVGLSVAQIETAGFSASERARAAADEDGDFMAAFVNFNVCCYSTRFHSIHVGMRGRSLNG